MKYVPELTADCCFDYFQIAGIGHVNSFGLIYRDFMVDTHSSAKSLTTAHGVFAVMLAIGGKSL